MTLGSCCALPGELLERHTQPHGVGSWGTPRHGGRRMQVRPGAGHICKRSLAPFWLLNGLSDKICRGNFITINYITCKYMLNFSIEGI